MQKQSASRRRSGLFLLQLTVFSSKFNVPRPNIGILRRLAQRPSKISAKERPIFLK